MGVLKMQFVFVLVIGLVAAALVAGEAAAPEMSAEAAVLEPVSGIHGAGVVQQDVPPDEGPIGKLSAPVWVMAYTEQQQEVEQERATLLAAAPQLQATGPDTYGIIPFRAWQLISAVFPEQPITMSRIAFCESRYVANVVGEGKYLGWFQLDPAHLRRADVIAAVGVHVPADLFDPSINTAVARVLANSRPDLGDWAGTRDGCAGWSTPIY